MLEIKPQNSSRISEKLLNLYEELVASTDTSSNTPSSQVFSTSSDILQLEENGTKVSVRITSDDVEALLPALKDLGFETIGSAPDLNFIEGWMPINRIPDLENLDSQGLMGVLPVYAPITNVGSVTSQADFVHETDRVRASLPTGFDGTGVTVGVLSDSYNISGNGSATADIASGDLPTAGVNVLQDLSSGGSDEGRAMLQLIHDLAPGADLAFATAFISPTNFANNIRALANTGSEIIVDDVGYLTEPFFQDGVVSLAVDDVVTNNGVAYFSSAGNSGNIAYESANINFVSDTIGGISGNFYDFDSSPTIDTRQRITIPDGQRIRLSFQWDDPFFTTSGVDTDLDIFLLNAATGQIVANSRNDNIVNQTPSEFLVFTNNTGQTDFDVAIQSLRGPEPGRIKYIPFDLGSDPNQIYQEFATNSSTIFAHPAATNASAVAAVPYFDQQNPESFTSIGPTTILFEPDGTRKTTPEIRQTPDIAAIDGTDTTFFGNSDFENTGFRNFFGTSAAAPHAAAIAALVKEANPTFTPEQIYNRLESTAIDIGTPGFDNVTGHGLINAYDAVFGPVVPTSLNFSDNFEDGDLPLAYETNTNGAGRIQVTRENNPIGTRHLTLDSSFGTNNFSSLNEVILHVNTTGFNDVQLSFDQREFGDEDNPMPSTFTGSNNSDGVALSVDGTNWFSLISLTGSNSTEIYQTQTFNLSTFAANNGLTLGSDVRIKFQQFDNFPINSDGFAFDNISVTGTANTPPTITSNPTFSVAENTTTVGTITATDANDDNLTFSISGGADQGLFTIDSNSGQLSFNSAPNFENPGSADGDNNYQVTIGVFDGTQTVTQDLTVSVTDVGEVNTPPTITSNSAFSVAENTTTVGTITATDANDDKITFSISGGADQGLFTIDSNSGELSFNSAPDFETPASADGDNNYQVSVEVSDSTEAVTQDLTVSVTNLPPAQFDTDSNNGIFSLNGGDSTNIKFTLANNNTENVNEVGIFVVDDENGSVDGLAPGSDGYLQAALQRSQVIFSAISNRPSGFDLGDIERVLELNGDTRLGFYFVSNGTTDTALTQLEVTGSTNLPIFFSDSSNLQVSDVGTEGFKLNWSDEAGGTDFTNLDLSVQLTQDVLTPGTQLQGESQQELIDLSNQTGQVSVSVEVYREAAFDNLIGFYKVVDTNGGIDINSDGIADFNPGDAGYEEAALTNRVTGLDLLKTDNQQATTFDGNFDGGSILAPFIVIDGTVDQAINNNAEVYFSFLGANSDGVDHIRLLGDNTFGFEDLPGGGDLDYNDVIVKVNFPTV